MQILMYFIRHRHFLLPFEAARRAGVGDVGLTFFTIYSNEISYSYCSSSCSSSSLV